MKKTPSQVGYFGKTAEIFMTATSARSAQRVENTISFSHTYYKSLFEPKEEHSTLDESQVSNMDQGEDGDANQLNNGGIYYFCTLLPYSSVTSVVEFEGAEMIFTHIC